MRAQEAPGRHRPRAGPRGRLSSGSPPLNPRLKGLGKSATLAINERSAALIAQGRDVIRFGLGQSPFPVPEPVVEALRVNAHQKDYLAVEGLPALREAYTGFLGRVDGIDADPGLVLLGPGSKELLFIAQLAFEGDLLIPAPCWVSYRPQAQIIGKGVQRIPTTFEGRWRLDPDALDRACEDGRPRLLILNYPGNPDGLTYSDDELRALARVARERGIIVLSDEIYGLLHHRGEHVSIARHYPEGTIVSGGLSKWCGAGGWRLGAFAFPEELAWLHAAAAAIASETYTSVSAPIQHAAVTAFTESPAIADYVERSRGVLRTLAARILPMLQGAGIRVHPPDGAFYLVLDFEGVRAALGARGIEDSETLCERLLQETGVAILPGSAFELEPEHLAARLAYVDFDGAESLQHRDPEAAVNATCGRVIDGVRRICRWTQEAGGAA